MRDFESEERLRRERKRAAYRRMRRQRERRRRMMMFGGAAAVCLIVCGIWFLKPNSGEKDAPAQLSAQGAPETKEAAGNAELSGSERQEDAVLSGTAAEPEGQEESADTSQDGETEDQEDSSGQEDADAQEEPAPDLPFAAGYTFTGTDSGGAVNGETVTSSNAVLIDLDDNRVVVQRGAGERIIPASMTKILTVLVAAEHVTDLDDTFTITREITDYSYSHDCSSAGFGDGETVTVRDLFYGTVLPSGADAAAGLACYVAGSLDGFVALMNEKLEELGISDTAHFTNCVGLYDENHYCTLYDMAVILKAAVENDLCREVLSAHTYTTSSTEQHPEGILISNWFLRRIEDKETNGEVVCAKTGYVAQSGSCAASYEITDSGKHYICVTADAHSSWRCIYDHVAIYEEYTE